jgi:hypothetical protein
MVSKKERRRRVRKNHQGKNHQRPSRPIQERDDSGPRQYTLNHRARKLSEIISAYPQQIALGLANRDDASWIFGRLYLVGALDYDQKAAAERLNFAVATYRRLLHRYHGPKLSNPNLDIPLIDGGREEDLSPAAEKRFEKARREYDRHMEILHACGQNVEEAVMNALEKDVLVSLALVCQGLNALCALRKSSAA